MTGRRPRSLHASLRWFMVGVTALVIVIYSLQLHEYFNEGLDQSLALELRLIAEDFQSRRAQDPATPLPEGPYTWAFFDWRQMPDLSADFELDSLRDGELEHDFQLDPQTREPSQALFLLPVRLDDGSRLFVLRRLTPDLFTVEMKREFNRLTFYRPGVLALVILGLAVLFVQIYIRRLDARISELSEWSQGLSLEASGDPPPSMGYRELDQVAQRLHGASLRISRLLQREQDFLRHASHELRTPISVVRNTAELLERQLGTEKADEKAEARAPERWTFPVARIRRAALSMQLMTETLLWLSREQKNLPEATDCVLAQAVSELVEQHGYLLDGKSVEVDLQAVTEEPTQAAVGPLSIVLANLVRNAFQHSQGGRVRLVCDRRRVEITNQDPSIERHRSSEEGGSQDSHRLGLELCRQICELLGWSLDAEPQDGGFRVVLSLPDIPRLA